MHASSPTEHVVTAGANGSARPTGSRRKSASSPAGAYGKEHKTVPAESEPKVTTVVLGNLPLRSWYSSFYPKELVGDQIERLCVCHWCFKYSKELMPYLSHQRLCSRRQGCPGRLVYNWGGCRVYEVDGKDEQLFTQNLSLFAKLFLDTKSVFYDVTTFFYYVLELQDSTTAERQEGQIVGFFSKEKMSWDNNNLACILVFPPWQKRGLGQVLMGVSYELSRREKRLGGPERPLSDLGRHAYEAYWSGAIARQILSQPASSGSLPPADPQHADAEQTVSIRALSEATYILPDDVMAALKSMQVLASTGVSDAAAAAAMINKAKIRAWVAEKGISLEPAVEQQGFVSL